MQITLLVEGKSDELAVKELVEGIRRHLAPKVPSITWQPSLTERGAGIRQRAGATLRSKGVTWPFIILTDAWCTPDGYRNRLRTASGKTNNQAKLVGSSCTGWIQQQVRANLALSNYAASPAVVGVACADLETWFLSSSHAMGVVGSASAVVRGDPQADCDGETVEIKNVGKGLLERSFPRYSAKDAKDMAREMVSSPHAIAAARQANASFDDFVTQILNLFQPPAQAVAVQAPSAPAGTP